MSWPEAFLDARVKPEHDSCELLPGSQHEAGVTVVIADSPNEKMRHPGESRDPRLAFLKCCKDVDARIKSAHDDDGG